MKLALVTCTHGRPELTRAVLECYVSSKSLWGVWAGIARVAVGDARVKGWQCYPFDNEPLGAKWNEAFRIAAIIRETPPDLVIVTGSDDLISPSWVKFCTEKIAEGWDYISPHVWYMADLETDRVSRMYSPTGAGRCYSRRLLDLLDWRLWNDDTQYRLDSEADGRLFDLAAQGKGWRQFDAKEEDMGPHIILDIKTGEGMWTFDEMEAVARHKRLDVGAKEFIQWHFPEFQMELV